MGQPAYDVGSVPLRAVETHSTACLNCQSPLTGPFCASCGQRDVPPYPSVRELAVDAFWELSGWDGRFASTVRALVSRPGMLTLEFLEGRRARYLSPVRLYLMASLAFFVLAAAAPKPDTKPGENVLPGVSIGATATRPSAPSVERVASTLSKSLKSKDGVTPAERADALQDIERAPGLMRPFLRRMIGDPDGFKRGLAEDIPRMLFMLLPVFAAIVAMFYRGRKYPEHLYFAIHLSAFVFLALTVPKLASFAHLPALRKLVGDIAAIWIVVYATMAFRRVYGGSILRTLAKEAVIASIYGIASLAGLIGVVYWVSIVG